MAEEINIEKAILKEALKAVYDEAGLDFEVLNEEIKVRDHHIDAIIRIKGIEDQFSVEIKRWAAHGNLGVIINQVRNLPMEGIFIADYVNPKMAGRLREQGVQFIDTVGNAYINRHPIHIYIKGNRKKDKDPDIKKEGTGRAFNTTGLKVVYAFLCNPELINANYREIADVADVALGTVGWVLNDLKEMKFVIGRGHKRNDRRIKNHKKLFDRWVEAYPEKLRPKQVVGKFIAKDPFWWEEVDIRHYQGYWGGEVAAAKYTENYLRPEEVILYLPKEAQNQFFADARLRKVIDQNVDKENIVKIYRPFWREQKVLNNFYNKKPNGLAHPILVYADLIATADVRNMEVAKMIYERQIAKYIGKD